MRSPQVFVFSGLPGWFHGIPGGDRHYEITVEMDVSDCAQGGLLLYYSDRLFCGMGHHIVTQYYSLNGTDWTRHGLRFNVEGYNTNTADELLSLRPALFATGTGEVRFRNFTYRAFNE